MNKLTHYAEGYDHVICRVCDGKLVWQNKSRIKWHMGVYNFMKSHNKSCKKAYDKGE